MNRMRFRAINHKGKREYVWDPKGKYVRHNNEFVRLDKLDKVDPKIAELKKEFNKVTKNHPYVRRRLKPMKNIEKKIYYAKCWIITEENDLTVLKNHDKRGFRKYHLDHIYSIAEGFRNNVPPEAIGHIDNLRFIHYRKNLKKRDTVDDSSKKLITEIVKKINK